MATRGLQFVLLGALVGICAAPRSAEAGIVVSAATEMAALSGTGSQYIDPVDPAAPQPDDSGVLHAAIPASNSTGCGSPLSLGSYGLAGVAGLPSVAFQVEPPALLARLLFASQLVFPNPPPLGLLRPPRVSA